MTTQTIATVDLRDYADPAKRPHFITALGDALRDLGFVAVEGYDIDSALFDETYAAFRDFFALPDDIKRTYEHPETGRRRGYTSFGIEHAKDNANPDLKEFFHVGRELPEGDPDRARLPINVWPTEVATLKSRSMELYDALDRVAFQLLEAFSVYLGETPDLLPSMAKKGNTIQRIIHYPVCDGFDEPGTMRAAQHEDINLMTLLPPAEESGLELLTRDGKWMPIEAIPGQIIVDTGDMMKRITNDEIPATTHRVVNPKGDPRPRYSMPFFVHPHLDVMLEVLESCIAPGGAAKYPPINNETFLLQRLQEIGVKA
ncbi:MAG: 2-oxoglutarate and iron-dependent oxygenase domain-containing protein [Myxococcota bacterium]